MTHRMLHVKALIMAAVIAAAPLALDAADRGARSYGPATLEYRLGVPFLKLSGSYYDMGFQYGTLMKDEVKTAYSDMDRSVKAFFSMVPPILRPLARLVYNHVASKKGKTIPRDYRDELRGFADATGLEYDYIIRTLFISDIVGSLGCTSGIATGGGTVIHGRNLDFPPTTLGRYPLVVDYRPAGKRGYTLVGIVGYLPALSGMNEAGISITLNLSFMAEDYKKPVMPVGYKIRDLLGSAASLEEVDALMKGYASDQGWFFTVASAPDKSGVIYNIAGGEIRKSPLSGAGVFVENRFLFEDMNMKYKTLEDSGGDYNVNRTETVGERLPLVRSVDDMTALLRSTDYYGYRDISGKFTVNNYETVQSMVLVPATGDIYFSSAPMYAGLSRWLRYNRKTGAVSVYREADPRMGGDEMRGMIAWADLLYADPKKALGELKAAGSAGPFQLAMAYRLWQFDPDLIDLAGLIPSMDRAIEKLPDDATFLLMKGDALLSAKKYGEAAAVLEQGLKSGIAAPGDIMMLNAVLAKTYHKTGNKKQAALHADTALSMLTRYRLKGEQKKLKRQLERIR
ncbi:MAG TPA: C45 family autoproteolytic acyltransferase/hydrolase [Spirochaetota bacterium]|nr:hypothetical protein [Spirochaetota bacterium]HOD13570.1 C45 family autoproteolytic acyltransferase/hydrolase [Spirochaetota bacterium]HPG49714.1 C45 family autoproteolytic acyltransferase/hydrolase [Spirochaetota bacterium]HPN10442.1 C45 family autoproteolytic acyltransferase/hydrolase [Spirochaetota bacterium]HQL80987.1 C45 family autoproteolytic acyltransferase/hydrolase [Spirochaetota bacterium]